MTGMVRNTLNATNKFGNNEIKVSLKNEVTFF